VASEKTPGGWERSAVIPGNAAKAHTQKSVTATVIRDDIALGLRILFNIFSFSPFGHLKPSSLEV